MLMRRSDAIVICGCSQTDASSWNTHRMLQDAKILRTRALASTCRTASTECSAAGVGCCGLVTSYSRMTRSPHSASSSVPGRLSVSPRMRGAPGTWSHKWANVALKVSSALARYSASSSAPGRLRVSPRMCGAPGTWGQKSNSYGTLVVLPEHWHNASSSVPGRLSVSPRMRGAPDTWVKTASKPYICTSALALAQRPQQRPRPVERQPQDARRSRHLLEPREKMFGFLLQLARHVCVRVANTSQGAGTCLTAVGGVPCQMEAAITLLSDYLCAFFHLDDA